MNSKPNAPRSGISWPWLIAALANLVLWALFVLTNWLPENIRVAISDTNALVIFYLGAVLTFKAARAWPARSRQRLAWQLLGLTQAIYATGDLYWAFEEILFGVDPTYSAVNFAYFAIYPLIIAALILLPRTFRSSTDRWLLAVESILIGVCMTALIWQSMIHPELAGLQGESDPMVWLVGLGYPIADLIILIAASVCLLRTPPVEDRRALRWLAIGMFCNFFGDTTWVYATTLGEFNADSLSAWFWLATAWSWLLAGVHLGRLVPQQNGEQRTPVVWQVSGEWLTVLAVSALGWLVWQTQDGKLLVVGGVLVMMSLLAIFRQLYIEREVLSLNRERLKKQTDARIGAIVQQSSNAIFLLDRRYHIVYASPGATRLFDEPESKMLQQAIHQWIHPDDNMLVVDDLAAASLQKNRDQQSFWRMRTHDDRWLWTEVHVANLLDEPGIGALMLNVRDVTAKRELENRLRFLALHDGLTALPNRGLFEDRLAHALAMQRHPQRGTAVMLIDLDHFKLVNETLGHDLGDQILKACADRIETCLGGRDRAGRLGADRFAVQCEYQDANDAHELAQRIAASLSEPFTHLSPPVSVTASIGMAHADLDDDSQALIQRAEAAMLEAKRSGRNAIKMYDPRAFQQITSQIEIQNELRDALHKGRFSVVYQPIVDSTTQKVYGVEALLRSPDLKKSRIDMETLIGHAEQCGIIVPLGHWVMSIALRDIAPLIQAGELKSLTINLSWRQLENPSLPEEIESLLRDVQLEPEKVLLEVTESGHLIPERSHHEMLLRLSQIGVRLGLDDFGTGASSISTLRYVPMSLLKIPKHCVDELEKPNGSRRLVDALQGLASRMNMHVVAEGVETARQAEALRQAGCRLLQGYYFGRGMPIDDLRHWLKQRQAVAVSET